MWGSAGGQHWSLGMGGPAVLGQRWVPVADLGVPEMLGGSTTNDVGQSWKSWGCQEQCWGYWGAEPGMLWDSAGGARGQCWDARQIRESQGCCGAMPMVLGGQCQECTSQ